MYRCQICGNQSDPSCPRLVHVEYREVPRTQYPYSRGVKPGPELKGVSQLDTPSTRKQIAREWAVCRRCKDSLEHEVELSDLIRYYRPVVVLQSPTPIAEPVRVGQPAKRMRMDELDCEPMRDFLLDQHTIDEER